MGLFSSAKAKLAAQKLSQEKLYEIAAEEIAANNIPPGLWAKAEVSTAAVISGLHSIHIAEYTNRQQVDNCPAVLCHVDRKYRVIN